MFTVIATILFITVPRPGLTVPSLTTSYTCDAVGNRLTRTTVDGTETFNLGVDYQLNSITTDNPNVLTTHFEYDLNGNTSRKYKDETAGLATLYYKNLSGMDRTFTFNGKRVVFAQTSGNEFQPLNISGGMGSTITLKSEDGDADGSHTISIDRLEYATETSSDSIEASDPEKIQYSSALQLEDDPQARGGLALGPFGATGSDLITWQTTLPETEDVHYTWDELNRLIAATRTINEMPRYQATFDYGTFGWQANTQTVHDYFGKTDDVRSYGYGFDGEMLSESHRSGMREYVNGSIDHVLWTFDSANAGNAGDNSRYWLTDVNGSVFGIASGDGTVLERQRYDAFGTREVFDHAVGAPDLENRTGYQGRTDVWEVGLTNFRHRWYDPGTGRFLSIDPLGMVDGAAWYSFCHHDPINGFDPMGLEDGDPEDKDSQPKPGDGKHSTNTAPLKSGGLAIPLAWAGIETQTATTGATTAAAAAAVPSATAIAAMASLANPAANDIIDGHSGPTPTAEQIKAQRESWKSPDEKQVEGINSAGKIDGIRKGETTDEEASKAAAWTGRPVDPTRPIHGADDHDATAYNIAKEFQGDPRTLPNSAKFNQQLQNADGLPIPEYRPDAQRIRHEGDRRVVDVTEVQSPSQSDEFMGKKVEQIRKALGDSAGTVKWVPRDPEAKRE